jgi:hypothetical protein
MLPLSIVLSTHGWKSFCAKVEERLIYIAIKCWIFRPKNARGSRFISGPHSKAISEMGDKLASKRLAKKVNLLFTS